MSLNKSNFRLLMECMVAIAQKKSNGRYFVKRGGIGYDEFPFSKFPRVISIQCDERDFMKQQNKADITLEIIHMAADGQEFLGINDKELEEATEMAESIITTLTRSADPESSDAVGNFAFGVFPGRIIEQHDLDYRVQGILAKLTIAY